MLQIVVEADNAGPHTLRDRAAEALAGEGVTVISAHCAHATKQFVVHGVDTASGEPFNEHLEAADADEAREKAATGRRVVAHIAPAD